MKPPPSRGRLNAPLSPLGRAPSAFLSSLFRGLYQGVERRAEKCRRVDWSTGDFVDRGKGAGSPQTSAMTRAESVVEGTPSRGMAAGQPYPSLEALLKLEASLKDQFAGHGASPQDDGEVRRAGAASCVDKGRTRLRKLAVVGGTLGGLVLLALFALWWRLSSGPIELDIATPWLTAAIKENFGPGHEVE